MNIKEKVGLLSLVGLVNWIVAVTAEATPITQAFDLKATNFFITGASGTPPVTGSFTVTYDPEGSSHQPDIPLVVSSLSVSYLLGGNPLTAEYYSSSNSGFSSNLISITQKGICDISSPSCTTFALNFHPGETAAQFYFRAFYGPPTYNVADFSATNAQVMSSGPPSTTPPDSGGGSGSGSGSGGGSGGVAEPPSEPPPPPTKTQQQKDLYIALSLATSVVGAAFSFAGDVGLGAPGDFGMAGLNLLVTGTSIANNLQALPVPITRAQEIGLQVTSLIQLAKPLITTITCPECAALSMIGTLLDAASGVLRQWAEDPPDANYQTLPTRPSVSVSAAELSSLGPYAATTAAVLTAADAVISSSYLALSDLEKFQGAQAAGDTTFETLYANRYQTDEANFRAAWDDLVAALTAFRQDIESDPVNNLVVDLSRFVSFQQAMSQSGVPTDLLSELEAYGIVPDMVSLRQIEELMFDTQFASLNLAPDTFSAIDEFLREINPLNGVNVPEPGTLTLLGSSGLVLFVWLTGARISLTASVIGNFADFAGRRVAARASR